VRPCTEESVDIESFTANKNSRNVLCVCKKYDELMPYKEMLLHINIDTCESKDYSINAVSRCESALLLNSGNYLLCTSTYSMHGINENPLFYIINGKSGESELINEERKLSCWQSVNTDVAMPAEIKLFEIDD
jgi:hypothetical protein